MKNNGKFLLDFVWTCETHQVNSSVCNGLKNDSDFFHHTKEKRCNVEPYTNVEIEI